jgi:hypothetical protein
MNDQNSDDWKGGSEIQLGEDTEICFDQFSIHEEYVPRYESAAQLLKGALHVIHKRWKGTSIFSTHQPTTVIIGIRGSEVFIQHDPDLEFVQVLVIEGHVDITSEKTDETVSLTNNQGVEVVGGDIMDTVHVSQEMWDSYMEEYGLGDADFPKLEIDEYTSNPTYNEDESIDGQNETVSRNSNVKLIIFGALMCVIIVLGNIRIASSPIM